MAPPWIWSWLLTLLAIQIGCDSAAGAIYPSVATGVEWVENMTLQNLEGVTARPAVYSVQPDCFEKDPAELCTQNCLNRLDFCSSFSYLANSTHCTCKLYRTPNFLIGNMNRKKGSRYFYAKDENCPVHRGYRLLHFEADRNLCLLYLGKMRAKSYTTRQKCGIYDGVLPKLTNKYVTDVIIEYVRAIVEESNILIEAGGRKVNDVWLWDFDGTPISTQPRSSSEGARDDPAYWNHTFWYASNERANFSKDCMYTDENGWFTDHCDSLEKDFLCQYRYSGPPWEGIADPAPSMVIVQTPRTQKSPGDKAPGTHKSSVDQPAANLASLSREFMVIAALARAMAATWLLIWMLGPPLHFALV